MKYTKNINWFTLIEIMVSILIVSLVIIWWFQALSAITIWKAKIIQTVDTQKEAFYFTQKLFEMIKKWWTLDYEEYFNRKVINSPPVLYSSWHFAVASWFWNYWYGTTPTYWQWFYYCRSDNGSPTMWTGWCYDDLNLNTSWNSQDGFPQRYWEYSYQFIDYNSNFDGDWWMPWDEDWDGNIIWDDDDEYIWDWPEVFTSWTPYPELYLISWDKKKRTYFRWTVIKDPNAPSWEVCNINSNNNTISWNACLWTIEYIRFVWVDRGMDHDISTIDSTQNDWIIDTWIVDYDIDYTQPIAWDPSIKWIPLFSDYINVSEFKVYAYPNKNISYAWKNTNNSVNISPYIELKIKISPSWISRKKLKWVPKDIDYSMTINLTDIYSK